MSQARHEVVYQYGRKERYRERKKVKTDLSLSPCPRPASAHFEKNPLCEEASTIRLDRQRFIKQSTPISPRWLHVPQA